MTTHKYDPNCPSCKGTGLRDSGGTQPWGEPIMIPCDCYECEDCIGMKEHGCFCAAMGSPYPGGGEIEKMNEDEDAARKVIGFAKTGPAE